MSGMRESLVSFFFKLYISVCNFSNFVGLDAIAMHDLVRRMRMPGRDLCRLLCTNCRSPAGTRVPHCRVPLLSLYTKSP